MGAPASAEKVPQLSPTLSLILALARDAGQRHELEAELHRSRRRLAEAEALARIGSWEWDIPANRVSWSDELYRIYGHEPGSFEPTYERFLDHVHPDDRAAVDERNHKAFADHQPFEDVKRVVRADGTEFLMRTTGEVICDADGAPLRMLGVCEDVTTAVRAAEAEGLLAAIVRSSTDAVSTRDARGRVTSWNPGAELLYGWKPEEMIGRTHDRVVDPERADEDQRLFAAVLAGERVDHLETVRRRRDGSPIDVSVSVSAIVGSDGAIVGVSEIARDIQERKRFEERLRHLADHDTLTGLFNRRRFAEELQGHCSRARRFGDPGAVLAIDLDGFKYVNDTAGHGAGDELLRTIGSLLAGRVRSSDVVARVGGDEFAVLLPRATDEDARTVGAALLEAIRHHTAVVGGVVVRATASIGIVLHEERGSPDAEDLISAADRAMYAAKDAGRDTLVVHTPELARTARSARGISWQHRIHSALANEGFVLDCQPIVDATTLQTRQHELLLRMRDGDELLPPAAFLGVAERLGLVHSIDCWVAQQAVALLERHDGLRLSMNLSGLSIGDAELPALIATSLEERNVDGRRLVIEITETAAIANLDEARRFAERLSALGCRLALDDFGTGFGSFTYLKYLPVHELKIDGEFVRSPQSHTNDLIVEAIVGVARGLGMTTIAEHVSDALALERMRAAGVDCLQGFHVGRPTAVTTLA